MVQVARCIHNFSCSSAVLVNIFFVRIIARKTPNNLRTYSIVLLNFAYIEIVTAIASMLAFHRIMNTEGYILIDFTGLCQLSGSRNICTNVYAVMMHGHSQYCLLIAFSFSYRYYVIKKSAPKKSTLIALLVVFYIPTVLVYLLFATTPLLDAIELRRVMFDFYPAFDYDSRSSYFLGAEMKGTVLLATLWIQSVILPVYTVTIVATILVHNLLKANLKMSENSKKMHKEIMKGLLFQSLMPNLYFIAVGYSVAKHTGMIENWDEAGYITVTLGSIIIAASPLITLYFIKPYRLIVKSLLPGGTMPVVSAKASLSEDKQRKITVSRKETQNIEYF